jgi:uncharacterized protein YlzI (FlbEa/FlbD family)
MFNVHPSVRLKRLEICKDCKFYKPSTGSCGTLIIGGIKELERPCILDANIEGSPEDELANRVSYYRKKIKLCGCIMSWKTKYTLSSCPAGKWGAERLTGTQIELLQTFLKSLNGKQTIVFEDVKKLYEWKSKLTGKHEPITTCGTCVGELILEMNKEINRI